MSFGDQPPSGLTRIETSIKQMTLGKSLKIVVLLLALGVSFGFFATLASMAQRVYLSLPAGVADQEYVTVGRRHKHGPFGALSLSDVKNIRKITPEISWFYVEELHGLKRLDQNGGTHPLESRSISSNYLRSLGVPAFQGQLSPPTDSDPAVVVSSSLWHVLEREQHGAASLVLDLSDGVALPVLGAVDAKFGGLFGEAVDAWLINPPLSILHYIEAFPTQEELRHRWPQMWLFGILDEKIPIAALRILLNEYSFDTRPLSVTGLKSQTAMRVHLPGSDGDRLEVVEGIERFPDKRRDIDEKMMWLAGILVLLLCLAQIFLVDFLATQIASRQHEQRVRMAVGATPVDLFTHILLKNGAHIAVVAGVAWITSGYIYAAFLRVEPFSSYLENGVSTPTWMSLGASFLILMMTFLLAATSASVSAAQTSRNFFRIVMQESQVPLATRRVLIFIATASLLFVFSLANQYFKDSRISLGLANTDALITSLQPGDWLPPKQNMSGQLIHDAFKRNPSVQSVAQTQMMPLSGRPWTNFRRVEVIGRPELVDARLYTNATTPSYFSTLDVDMIAGRAFSGEMANEVVLARSTAELLAGGVDESLGMVIAWRSPMTTSPAKKTEESPPVAKTVVGVAEDIPYVHYAQQPVRVIYQNTVDAWGYQIWVVKHSGDPADILAPLHNSSELSGWQVDAIGTPGSLFQQQFAAARSLEISLAGASCFVFMLAFAGIASSLARTLSNERTTIGMILALGATRLHLFLRYFGGITKDFGFAFATLCALVLIAKVVAPLYVSLVELWLLVPLAACVMALCASTILLTARALVARHSIIELVHGLNA